MQRVDIQLQGISFELELRFSVEFHMLALGLNGFLLRSE